VPDEKQPGTEGQQLTDEIVWAVQRLRLLLRYWTMPLLVGTAPGTSREETISARAFALLVIVTLTFAIRGDISDKNVSFTALAAAVAVALSFALHILATTMKVTVREPAIISAYASTILVMVGFLFVKATCVDANWFNDYLADYVGQIVASAIVSVVVIYVLLVLKALLWDKNHVSAGSAAIGLMTTIASGTIVCIVYYLSNDQFNAVKKFLCLFGSCRG
jgi:hypothetical protein